MTDHAAKKPFVYRSEESAQFIEHWYGKVLKRWPVP